MPDPAKDVLLGVDAGGSKTRATLAQLSEGGTFRVLGAGTAGPGNPLSVGLDNATHAIEQAIARARLDASSFDGPIRCAVIAAAGAASQHAARRISQWATGQRVAQTVEVVPDAAPLLAAASLSGPALGVVSGTGSIAVARSTTGETFRAGGWGYLLGDEGSGYAIGRAAIRAVLLASRATAASTPLKEAVLYGLSAPTIDSILPHVYESQHPRNTIAALAKPVLSLADAGDETCMAIAHEAARSLADTALEAAKLAGLYRQMAPLAVAGSVLVHSAPVREAVLNRLAAAVKITELVIVDDLTLGALKLAAHSFK